MYGFRMSCNINDPQSLSFKTAGNTIYSPSGKSAVDVCGNTTTSDDWFKLGLDPGTVVKVSPSVDTIIGWGKSLFGIQDE